MLVELREAFPGSRRGDNPTPTSAEVVLGRARITAWRDGDGWRVAVFVDRERVTGELRGTLREAARAAGDAARRRWPFLARVELRDEPSPQEAQEGPQEPPAAADGPKVAPAPSPAPGGPERGPGGRFRRRAPPG